MLSTPKSGNMMNTIWTECAKPAEKLQVHMFFSVPLEQLTLQSPGQKSCSASRDITSGATIYPRIVSEVFKTLLTYVGYYWIIFDIV